MRLDSLEDDLRAGSRILRRAPGSSLVMVATLGLALAASVATFGVLNAVLLADLPFHEPGRVVFLHHSYTGFVGACSLPSFLDYRQQTHAFERLSAAMPWDANLAFPGEAERLRGLQVSAEFFETLGAFAFRGRTFLPGEDEPGREHVVVVSYGLWQRRFAGDPRLLGRALRLNGESYQVVGVMPPGFAWGRAFGGEARGDLWAPYALTPERRSEENRGNEQLDVYGRLRPGARLQQAQAELDTVIRRLRARFPGRYTEASGFRLKVVPLHDEIAGPLRPGLVLVFGAVALLLLVAATNVSGLMLARAAARRRETALRVALGAGRGHLMRQVLAESFVLSAVAGGLGLLLAHVLCRALERIDRVSLPRSQPIAIDATVAGFALLATFAVALVAGLVPAWHVSRAQALVQVRGSGRREAVRGRRVLIVVQTATALVLLVQAGLLVRSLAALQRVEPGFRPQHVLTAEVRLPRSPYADESRRVRFVDEVLAGLSEQDGVLSAGAISELPLGGESNSGSFEMEGRRVPDQEQQPHSEMWSVTPGYFATLRIPLRRGRPFDSRDGAERTPVAIVSEGLARLYYPGEDAIGRRIAFEGTPQAPRWRQIVGVVGDVRDRRLDTPPGPQMYVPYAQRPQLGLFFVVGAGKDPLALSGTLRRAVRQQDAELPVFGVTPMDHLVSADTDQRRAARAALGGFSSAALLLAALGLYGLVAHAARERAGEVGVRMALGARRWDVARLFLGEGARLVLLGAVVGTPVALLASRLLQGYLFGVKAADPASYISVGLVLFGVALAASAVPAWRATRVDPARALQSE